MADHELDIDERAMWTFAGLGILIAMVAFAAIGFVVLTISGSDIDMGPRLAASAFIGFWGGPVFGMAGAVGYHDVIHARRVRRRMAH